MNCRVEAPDEALSTHCVGAFSLMCMSNWNPDALLTSGLVHDLPRVLRWARQPLPADATADLQQRAAALLKREKPFSVVNKTTTPASGDKHDYISMGPYWWPNPERPDGLPYIRRDGVVNPDFSGGMYDHGELVDFSSAVNDLTLAWLLYGEGQYASKAADLVRVWFLNPATRMNPNLRYGQMIPGVCDGRGIGLIDTKVFVHLIDHVLLLSRAGAITPQDLTELRAWFAAFLDWMLTHEFGRKERVHPNNHGTWCDVQLAGYALFVGRGDFAREVISEVPQRRIIAHILPDGSQPEELARTRALSYSCFNLQGLYALAWMGRHVGVDLWAYCSDDGRSLRKATDWLACYADPQQPWPYQQISKDGVADNPSLGTSARAPLVPLLRQAAIAFSEPRYLRQLEQLPGAETDLQARIMWPT